MLLFIDVRIGATRSFCTRLTLFRSELSFVNMSAPIKKQTRLAGQFDRLITSILSECSIFVTLCLTKQGIFNYLLIFFAWGYRFFYLLLAVRCDSIRARSNVINKLLIFCNLFWKRKSIFMEYTCSNRTNDSSGIIERILRFVSSSKSQTSRIQLER